MNKHLEDDLQMSFTKLLDLTDLTWFHIENERKCTPWQGAKRKRKGVKAGVLDNFILDTVCFDNETYKGLWIELKIWPNKLSPAQVVWSQKIRKCGYLVYLCYTIDEVINILRECYNVRF